MMTSVLIISDESERYYWLDFAKDGLNKGINYFLFDMSQYPNSRSATIFLDHDGKTDGEAEVSLLGLRHDEIVRMKFSEFDVAWYLRPGSPQSSAGMTALEAGFTVCEAKAAIQSTLRTVSCKWINAAQDIMAVENNKLYQQQIATFSGIRTPQSVITNDFDVVERFSRIHNEILIKTLGNFEIDASGDYFIYSQKISKNDIEFNRKAIQNCPVFVQEYISKKYEYRVIVAGENIISCRIHSQDSPLTRIDWRHYDFDNVKHEIASLPSLVEKALKLFMRSLGLRYGAIDLIETTDGDFVFLEINPSGQWGWLQYYAGLNVPEAVNQMIIDAVLE